MLVQFSKKASRKDAQRNILENAKDQLFWVRLVRQIEVATILFLLLVQSILLLRAATVKHPVFKDWLNSSTNGYWHDLFISGHLTIILVIVTISAYFSTILLRHLRYENIIRLANSELNRIRSLNSYNKEIETIVDDINSLANPLFFKEKKHFFLNYAFLTSVVIFDIFVFWKS